MQDNHFSIRTLSDLFALQERLANGENIIVGDVGQITHSIKLQGGRFDNYAVGYIDANIAKVVLSYQDSFSKIVSIIEKNYGIKNIDKTQLLTFKLEQGCLKIELENMIKPLLEGIKDMSDTAKVITIVSIALMILSGYSYSLYLTHNENLAKIEAESENRRIIADLKANKDLQNAINEPKAKIASVLQNDETATFNNEEPITYDKAKNYEFRELIDTTTTRDIEGNFKILGYEISNNGSKKFKTIVEGKTRWILANLIDAEARMRLATASINEREIRLSLRAVSEYNNITEITILEVGTQQNAN
ncbi:hypothetical protein [Campylobacter sp.]|uniref:hypothetical protein n=1 Tax=Campylobacter sp. TaxID=205 RepID=UPI00259CC0BF|nr:hypothetical protein [Campylobacter sp.]MBQ8819230.1 hypothetical protein [Campylobacter sp.]